MVAKIHTYGVLLSCCLLLQTRQVVADQMPTCQPSDFHYEYTECDSEGGRWRVSVPKPGVCEGGAPNPPIRGKDCSFTCSSGQYLDLNDNQECRPCPAGTYSLGGGVRFDDWDKLPDGFSINTEGLDNSLLWRRTSKDADVNCTKYTWRPHGAYIYSLPGSCTTTLTFSTKLVKAGHVTFEYQYVDPETIFHFIVQNDQCQAAEDENSSRWPEATEEGKWSSVTVELKTGMNVLQWRVIGALSDMVGTQKPVFIRKIEVTGVAFTSQCTKCRNGTYSSGGTAFCAPCEANKYSARGATQCEPCKGDEYAEVGSASCKPRPPCTQYDYYEFQTPCDSKKQTQKIYKWIEPKICNENAAGSLALPANTEPAACPPCNPGMYPVNNSCEFCPEGRYSNGALECKPCPASTSPEYGIDYKWWTVMPPNVTSHCIAFGISKCSESAGWQPAGDHIKTSFGPSDRNMFLVMSMFVAGFRGEPSTTEGKPTVLAEVRFTFETNCSGDCELLFVTDGSGKNTIVQSWTGTTARMEYVYKIHSNDPVTLSWAFQPVSYDDVMEASPALEGERVHVKKSKYINTLDSMAKIHAIKVTNTLGGGATRCQSCPKGTSIHGCVPCPDGQYVDPETNLCKECAPGTVLPSSNSWGKESCKPCGDGLKAVNKRVCKSDCHFTDKAGRHYDFTPLDGIQYVQGGRLFTASGTLYYHGFNITLCNVKNDKLPTCINNVTSDSQKNSSTEESELLSRHSMLNLPGKVSAMICRATMIPQTDPKKPLVSTQPVSLATHLTKIVSNVSLAEMYKLEGFFAEASDLDVHFYYKSETPTLACPEGRTTIISLSCDPDEKTNNSIQLPPKCADGTCDGCTFHFLWKTVHACPRCTRDDYEVIRGECVGGEQLIHYYPPSFCMPASEDDLKSMKQKCQMLPFAMMVAIPVTLGVGLILILLLIYCWSRNRKLEYKYSKLVESAGGRDGELPGVESCGMEEGEEDEAVHFADSKGPRLLHKIRLKISGIKNKDEDNPFIAVQMHEKLPLT